jgi:hypothetical protein
MISVADPHDPPPKARQLVDILERKCKVRIRLVKWRYAPDPNEFVLFIAPSKP